MRTKQRSYNIAMVAACPLPCPRGTPIRVVRSAQALAELGHRVHLVTYHLGEPPSLPRQEGLTVHRIPRVPVYRKLSPGPSFLKLALLDPLLFGKLLGVARREKIEVIYAHHYEGLMTALPAARLIGLPVVYDGHTILETELPQYGPAIGRSCTRAIGRWLDATLPCRADHIIAVSQEVADRLAAVSRVEARISVIPSGVELTHFAACRWTPEPDRAKTKSLIFTGNLASYQGIELMLHAFSRLRGRRDDVRLRIVTNDDFQRYASLAARLGVEKDIDVLASDYETLPRQLAEAAVALNPRVEAAGFPQKLLNYMAVGMPVVSFAGSARGLRHEENGLVVPDGETDALADAMDRLLDDHELATRLGVAARDHVERTANWIDVARQIETVLEGTLTSCGRSHTRRG